MDAKISLQAIILVIALFECESAALLRTPKVYNALITTDQNLTPSRAYPVIQPSLSDSAFFYGPYGYSPYGYSAGVGPYSGYGGYGGYYDPFGFNPFESATYTPKFNNDGTINAADESVSRSAGAGRDESVVINGGAVATEKSPIPLNEFGFPPSLIQLGPSNKNPVNLAPFGYNSYPLIYDQFGGYPQSSYLPHFGVLPQASYGPFGGTRGIDGANIGHDAVNGANGLNGVNGLNGLNGVNANGVPANVGPAIAAGPSGLGGVNGVNGINGVNGVNGVPGQPEIAGTIAPNVAGLDNAIASTPQTVFGSDISNPGNPVFFDRDNGVNHGGFPGGNPNGVNHGGFLGGNPNGVYGDNGIGGSGFESGVNDLNGGFSTAASNNGAFAGVNGVNRGLSSTTATTSSSGGNNNGLVRGSGGNDARLRGAGGSVSSSGFTQGSNGGSSGGSSASEVVRSSSSSVSASRSQGIPSSSSSGGSQQGSFVSALKNNSKV